MAKCPFDQVFPRDPRDFIADPVPVEHEMATACPVIEIPRLNMVMIGGYDQVVEAAKDNIRFVTALPSLDHARSAQDRKSRGLDRPFPRLLLAWGQDHYFTRRMVDACSTLDDREHWQPIFTEAAAEAFADLPRGSVVDLAPASERIAYGMLMAALGLDWADEPERAQIMDWFHAIEISFSHFGNRKQRMAAADALLDYYDWLEALIQRRRDDPQRDIISNLVSGDWQLHDEPAPRPLTDWEVTGLIRQLMLAGANSVRSQLLNCVLELCRDPALQSQLRADPALIPPFVEECLRLRSSVPGMWRSSATEFSFYDVPVQDGQLVQLRYKATGLDPDKFPDPYRIRLDRPKTPRHLAFGYGIHNCLGKDFARHQLGIALAGLLSKTQQITLGCEEADLRWLPSLAIHGVYELPVVLTGEAT
ncbi:MAG: hypothetical protein Alpg2KO_24760 [Alphaproteobacteria bacterium]